MSLENISIASCHVFIPQLTQSLDVFSSTDECRTDETTPRSYNRDVASRFVRPEYT
ncbi:uncharacterized, partial [Tachysurus ichikawai]